MRRRNFLGYERVWAPKQLLFANEQFHRDEMLPWYDHHLKGIENDVMKRPNVRFFVKNESKTLAASAWPPPRPRPST